jgi:hypothetical protein
MSSVNDPSLTGTVVRFATTNGDIDLMMYDNVKALLPRTNARTFAMSKPPRGFTTVHVSTLSVGTGRRFHTLGCVGWIRVIGSPTVWYDAVHTVSYVPRHVPCPVLCNAGVANMPRSLCWSRARVAFLDGRPYGKWEAAPSSRSTSQPAIGSA